MILASMNSSSAFFEYITMPRTFVTGGPPPVAGLRKVAYWFGDGLAEITHSMQSYCCLRSLVP